MSSRGNAERRPRRDRRRRRCHLVVQPVLDYSRKSRKPGCYWIGFAVGLGLAVAANLLPYMLTRHAYKTDGYERVGFPFTFRLQGGFSYRFFFSYSALLADIAIGVVAL
jgi:hypothetical protein